MKRLITLSMAFVLALSLAVPVFAGDPDPGSGKTNFTVMNISDTNTATVQADYISQNGSIALSWPVTIEPRSSAGFAADDAGLKGLPDNWRGSVVVSSDQPVVAFVQMIWTNSGLPPTHARYRTAGAYNGFTAGANKLYLPSLAQRTGSQNSVIAVQSAATPSTSETVAFTIRFYDRQGNLTHTINDTVYKGAQKTYDLYDYRDTFGGNWLGAAVIQANNPADMLTAAATMHWTSYSAAYAAVTGGGTRAYLPSGTRRVQGDSWLQYTGIIVQNLDPAAQATVRVTWYDRLGNTLHVFTDTIPANSSHGYNTRFIDTSEVPASSKATLGNDLTDDWNGSVVIESVGPNAPQIVAVANLQWGPGHSTSPNSASAYTSFSNGNAQVFIPQTFRRVSGTNWLQYTGLIVQNVGTTPCNNFTVTWVNRETGATVLQYTDSLPPNISHGYNTKVIGDIPAGSDPASLGNDYRGAVSIISNNCELVAIHNTIWPAWTDSSTYSGFGQ